MEATLRPKRSFSLHRYRPGERVGLSLVWLAPLIAQVEFDRRDVPASSRTRRIGRLGLLAVIRGEARHAAIPARWLGGNTPASRDRNPSEQRAPHRHITEWRVQMVEAQNAHRGRILGNHGDIAIAGKLLNEITGRQLPPIDLPGMQCRAGGEWIRNFSSAMPRHRQQRGRLHFRSEWRLPSSRPKQLYRFAEADDRSDNSAVPTINRLNPTHTEGQRQTQAAKYRSGKTLRKTASGSRGVRAGRVILLTYLIAFSRRGSLKHAGVD
jgi:hypothetical protein